MKRSWFRTWFKKADFKLKMANFIKWKMIDIYRALKYGKTFKEFGLTVLAGRQGSGKTTGMVYLLEQIRQRYPKAVIVTNFGYIHQHYAMESWRDFFEIRNGENGVVFAIDELQNEFSSTKWKDFPETLLSELTQQRKRRVKILATSQVFTRVAKQIREQTYEVVECKTWGGRWTRLKCYDADDYNTIVDDPSPEKKFKLWSKWKKSFIQTDDLRELFRSYEKIEKMKKLDFIPRNERGAI